MLKKATLSIDYIKNGRWWRMNEKQWKAN